MTRKQFIADIETAAASTYLDISNIRRGEEDGEVVFDFSDATSLVAIKLVATDVSGYPHDNTFIVCTEEDNVSHTFTVMMAQLQDLCNSPMTTIDQVLSAIPRSMIAAGKNAVEAVDDDVDDTDDSEADSDNNLYLDDAVFALGEDETSIYKKRRLTEESSDLLATRIRQDLTAVRKAGFKFGVLFGMEGNTESNLLSISIKISQLRLSAETLQAWDLESSSWVVLLVRYRHGYKSFDDIMQSAAALSDIEFRVGSYAGQHDWPYKPTILEAMSAFKIPTGKEALQVVDVAVEYDTKAFTPLLISGSLNELLNSEFMPMSKLRYSYNVDWEVAQEALRARFADPTSIHLPTRAGKNSDTETKTLPSIVTADHLGDTHHGQISLPLVAMQFAIHRLVRCTDFCMVCHDLIEEHSEALKPYVCSRSLCLYQYMNLGFGPNIEHEILTQPYVVDLLISFCYASAQRQRFREYPVGMNLTVAPAPNMVFAAKPQRSLYPSEPSQEPIKAANHVDAVKVEYHAASHEIQFPDNAVVSLHPDDWIVLVFEGPMGNEMTHFHFRVLEISLPRLRLAHMGIRSTSVSGKATPSVQLDVNQEVDFMCADPTTTSAPLVSTMDALMFTWNNTFDDFPEARKCQSILDSLNLLPTVKAMRGFLQDHPEKSLKDWTDRIPKGLLGLLRWIIASNRSYITQVEQHPEQDVDDNVKLRPELRVSGMDGFVQFLFAQGASDKEANFKKALENSATKRHPTIFAWHGSSLGNWHSIIRHGLDFEDTVNGRAFGNGVYHSQTAAISLGYATGWGTRGDTSQYWPGSTLQISQAFCLNEIVNAPERFVSVHPHLVVQHIDWIQCRYLFVKNSSSTIKYTADKSLATNKPTLQRVPIVVAPLLQDPKHRIAGVTNQSVNIPEAAIPASRRPRTAAINFQTESDLANAQQVVDEGNDPEDDKFMIESKDDHGFALGDMFAQDTPIGLRSLAGKIGGFVPGSLNHASLPITPEPTYATIGASRVLNSELRTLLKVQASTPQEELGWYINGGLVSNIYQWIVELHSFDAKLPLVADMKAALCTSIVCEIRFPGSFPIAPPFIRVIRPRFLRFMQGGGGNVTFGGAMCLELLTNDGWSAANSMEGVLLQVRLAIAAEKPAARLETGGCGSYSTKEACEAYKLACRTHGWQIPHDFSEFEKDLLREAEADGSWAT